MSAEKACAPMTNGFPLSHVFEHEGAWYCFDTITSKLYECDEVLAAVIRSGDRIADPDVLAPLEAEWGRERIEAAVSELLASQQTLGVLRQTPLALLAECPECADPRVRETQVRHLEMGVTEQCNLRCEYCSYGKARSWSRCHADVHMSRETALAAVDHFLPRCVEAEDPAISFYGGEPLLAFEVIREVVSHVRSRPDGERFRFTVDTNATLIDDEVAEFLTREKLNVQVSLDGPREIHDRYRRTKSGAGTWDRVVAGVDRLLRLDRNAAGRILFMSTLAPPYDVEAVVDFFDDFPLYRERGIPTPPVVLVNFAELAGLDFRPRDLTESSCTEPAVALRGLRRRYLEACRRGEHDRLGPGMRALFDKEIVVFHHRARRAIVDAFVPTGSCDPGVRKLFVRADGTFQPCERCGDDIVIGHVDRGIDAGAVRDLQRTMLRAVEGRCAECWAARSCSICFAHMAPSWKAEGGAKIPNETCEAIRCAFEGTLRDYLTLRNAGPQALEWLKNTTVK